MSRVHRSPSTASCRYLKFVNPIPISRAYSLSSMNAPIALCTRKRQDDAELFEYTSGRWIFNEKLRLQERRYVFDVQALKVAIARSLERPTTDIQSLTKLAEGGFNRVLQATSNDGVTVLARLPYPLLSPKHYAVASEAATLDYLRFLGIPVPKVLGYSTSSKNEVGAEYLLLEKIEGICLGNIWYIMDNKARKRINQQIVDIEQRLLRCHLPASGSLYYLHDLKPRDGHVPLDCNPRNGVQLVVGPTAQDEWHYKERTNLRGHMGPWKTFLQCFEAPARRELEWCEVYGRPRLHVERHLRELHDFQEVSPKTYQEVLHDYLKLAPSLDIPQTHVLSRPVLRHPDLSPNNILINEDSDIVGLIDWQHAKILPLCLAAGIPKHFQNWGDPESEKLSRPMTELPSNYGEMSSQEQAQTLEVLRRRLVHFLYTAKTMVQVPEHFDAMRDQGVVLRARLYNHATWPWEGDSITLQNDLAIAAASWPLDTEPSNFGGDVVRCPPCPLTYPKSRIDRCMRAFQEKEDKTMELGEMRDALDIDQQGWVPNDEHYEKSRRFAKEIKDGMLEEAKTEKERIAVLEHFPFDDHDEE